MLPLKLQEEYRIIKEYAEGGQSWTILVEKNNKQFIVKVPKVPYLFYIECGFDRKFLDSQIRLKGQRFFGLITR